MTITLTLPIPAAALSPNARVHHMAKHRAAKAARARAFVEARIAAGRSLPRWESAATQVVFFHPVKRRRDADNAAASLKAYWDGIADAGVVANDSGLRHASPRFEVDAANPRVEITITPLEDFESVPF